VSECRATAAGGMKSNTESLDAPNDPLDETIPPMTDVDDRTQQDTDGWAVALEYFPGVTSPRALFTMHIEGLDELLSRKPEGSPTLRVESEVCVIALVAYFEAFCKDVFAGAVNICPDLLPAFRAAGQGTAIDAVDLLRYRNDAVARIGNLIAEQIDFGSARKINAIYRALVKIAPFNGREMKRYDHLLNDRHLLVHHGGTYTSRYLAQMKVESPSAASRPLALEITPRYFAAARDLLETVADKLAEGARDRIRNFGENSGVQFSKVQWNALWLLSWDYTYR
jgi:hypothetical protein